MYLYNYVASAITISINILNIWNIFFLISHFVETVWLFYAATCMKDYNRKIM